LGEYRFLKDRLDVNRHNWTGTEIYGRRQWNRLMVRFVWLSISSICSVVGLQPLLMFCSRPVAGPGERNIVKRSAVWRARSHHRGVLSEVENL